MRSPEGWIYRVAINLGRRRLRRRSLDERVRRRQLDRQVLDGPAGEIWVLVADLPTRQRLAIVLRYVAGLTEREIAEVMGISRGGVSSTLRAAMASLRIELQSCDQEMG